MTTPNQNQPLKIEVGKFYKTRDGHKVRIYATDGAREICAIHGAYLMPIGWDNSAWYSNGSFYGNVDSEFDIISEWIDKPEVNWSTMPAWVNWVAQDKCRSWFGHENKPSISNSCWMSYTITYIPAPYAPQNYTGDWKDSLVERPS